MFVWIISSFFIPRAGKIFLFRNASSLVIYPFKQQTVSFYLAENI